MTTLCLFQKSFLRSRNKSGLLRQWSVFNRPTDLLAEVALQPHIFKKSDLSRSDNLSFIKLFSTFYFQFSYPQPCAEVMWITFVDNCEKGLSRKAFGVFHMV